MPHSAPLRTSPVQGGPHAGLNANQLKLLAVAAMVVTAPLSSSPPYREHGCFGFSEG